MKNAIQLTILLGVLVGSMMAMATDRQTANVATCKYAATDIGQTIVGHGANRNAAWADASVKCFDMRMDYYERRSGSGDLHERGLLFIDECANLRCS